MASLAQSASRLLLQAQGSPLLLAGGRAVPALRHTHRPAVTWRALAARRAVRRETRRIGCVAALDAAVAAAAPAVVAAAPAVAAAAVALPAAAPMMAGMPPSFWATAFLLGAAAVAVALVVKAVLDKPSRPYVEGQNTVGKEYDAWTEEGILEHYWGEHVHLGFYTAAEQTAGYLTKSFKQAKVDFTAQMLAWSGAQSPAAILDVGCGIGGSSRILAKRFPGAAVTGITLSPAQRDRAAALAAEQGVPNAEFRVMNALAMDFPDASFDLVWACESGEHMPDKRRYVEEMIRVLKPGGTVVIATWCQRETPPALSAAEAGRLQYLYDEWAHPYFISIEEYCRLLAATGRAVAVQGANWAAETTPSWRHSIWVGVWSPWFVIWAGLTRGPAVWWKVIREIVMLERMHRAFTDGLMTYGLVRATKTPDAEEMLRQKRRIAARAFV